MELLFALGLLAGIVQLLGYIMYLKIATIEPNPTTWLMFAYGTIVLTVLEFDAEATIPELILPSVCSVMAIVVALRCWHLAHKANPDRFWPRGWWPDNRWDRTALKSDLTVTAGYITSWILAYATFITFENRELAVFGFLILSNLSTVFNFLPIFRTTYHEPQDEHWAPWFTWTLAYVLLGVVTYLTSGTFFTWLMIYPALNAVLHISVGFLALRRAR